MEAKFDRRSFLRVAGTAFGIGALYSVFPGLTGSAGAEGITRTLAELNAEEKNALSHRGRALRAFAEKLLRSSDV